VKILILYTYNKGLLSEYFQELSEKLCEDGLEVVNFYLKHKETFFKQKGVTIYGEKRGGYIHNYRAIYNIIKQTKPDVIVSNFSYINPAVLFGKLLGVKHNIAWFHTAYHHTKPSIWKVINKRFYLKLADIVIANSRLLESELHTIYGVSKHNTRCIPFWTNITNYPYDSTLPQIEKNPSVLHIGCPGRLVADKNHKVAIEALYQLKSEYKKSIRLYIAGDGPNRNTLEALVKELGMEEDVIFLGLLNVNEMASFYRDMDVVVLPSFHEAFGLVFIEAIALGTPVLVSKAFGALDFINAQTFPLEAFSFNPYDTQELIDKLEPYLQTDYRPNYFKAIYDDTFEKAPIYNQIKRVLLNQPS